MTTTHNASRLSLLLLLILPFGCGSSRSKGKNTKPSEETSRSHRIKRAKQPPRFTLKDLLKTTVTIRGSWKESDVVFDDKEQWHCSGVVKGVQKGQLLVVTNKHCTGLQRLAKADPVGGPDVHSWTLSLITHNGRSFQAQHILVAKKRDLALLKSRPGRFLKGRDYILPPPLARPAIGEEVVAIGSPVDPKYSGTVTFGRVSALRKTFIQHDAALNPGNSGGPLYAKNSQGEYRLVGINTFKLMGSRFQGVSLEGLSFAISIQELSTGVFIEAPVDKNGACLLIRGLMNKGCNVK